jgi:hypothetical protein
VYHRRASLGEQAGHVAEERIRRERLLDEPHRSIDLCLLQDFVIDVPRHEDHTQGWIAGAQAQIQIGSATTRQHHIRDEHVERTNVGQHRLGLLQR